MLTSRARSAAVAAVAISALTLSACGDDSSDEGSSSSEALDSIEVTAGSDTKAPTVELEDAPVTASETESKALTEGKGESVADDALVKVDLAMFSGKDGKAIESSETYTAEPTVLDLGNQQVLPGLSKALQGTKIGGHGVALIPPKDLFGEKGNPELGIKGDETLVLVYDVKGVIPTEAEGSEVAPRSGLPKVEYQKDKPAKFTMPKGKPPKKLQVQPLVKGEGEKVKKDDTVYVTYTGALWKNGKVFDSSKKEGRGPFAFPVGGGQVIKGWDEGLVGQPVGSRVLLVVPPADGYGKQGSPDGSIKKDDTIVFVVDILAAM